MEWTKADWFFLGLSLGIAFQPIWVIGNRCIQEFKIAKEQWRTPK